MGLMSLRKAILLNGLLWGIGHAPLIYFGFNYGEGYWGAPFTGILLMSFCLTFYGVWLSYVTIKSSSIIPATIMHGSVNMLSILPGFVALSNVSVLLGPDVTGLIGMSCLVSGSIVLLILLKNMSSEIFLADI